MSELMKKAESHEAKGKWKNAAVTFMSAAADFLNAGDTENAKNLLLKAIVNAEKANINQLIVNAVFELSKIAPKQEMADILVQALKPINAIIEELIPKKKYELILENLDKKETIARAIGKGLSEVLVEKGGYLQDQAFKSLSSKKIDERQDALEAIKHAGNVFIEADKKEEKIEGEFAALKVLLEEGYLKEGLALYDELIAYCSTEALLEKAEKVIQQIIDYANEILEGKGAKKLAKAIKETINEDDPGGELLKIGIDKALELNSKTVITNASKIQVDFAEQMFEKKKYNIAKNFYDKSLHLLITIQENDEAVKVAQIISQKAYSLLEIKGKFNTGSEYFAVIHQMEKINLDYLGDFYKEKAEHMFTIGRIEIALEDYKQSSKALLLGKITEKFTSNANTIFEKAIILISQKDFTHAISYVTGIVDILEEVQAFEQIGKNLSKISVELVKSNQLKEANDYSIKAVENLIKAENVIEAGKSHKEIGESFLERGIYETASFHLIEAAKLFKDTDAVNEIAQISLPLVNAAKTKLTDGNVDLAQKLIMDAVLCAEQKDPLAQTEILMEFSKHAIFSNHPKVAIDDYKYASELLGKTYPEESKKIIQKLIDAGKRLIISDQNYELGKAAIEFSVKTLHQLNENEEASNIILKYGELFFDNKQNELAKELLLEITIVLSSDNPEIFGEKVTKAAKLLVEHSIVEEGIDLMRKSVGANLSLGVLEPISELAFYCSDKAKTSLSLNEPISAKHLFIAAMEFSSLVNLETQEQILTTATNSFLEINDLYSVKEFYDFARNNLEGEKDYLVKLGRLIILQGAVLRDQKDMLDESLEFIRSGIQILSQVEIFAEAGEAALAQGNAFIEKDQFVYGEELIETGAQIFIQINDIERSGDAFLSLAEINLRRELWSDALRQISLAQKSFLDSGIMDKLSLALIKTAEIGTKALTHNLEANRDFALTCFNTASESAKANGLLDIEVIVLLEQGKAFANIKDNQVAYNTFLQAVNVLEEHDEQEKSPVIAEELTSHALSFIMENDIQQGLHIIDLSTGIYLRLGTPIKASEVYMKACNALLKMNQIGEGVKLVLLASDTLMVAEEYNNAVQILSEIADLLYSMNDYPNASIVTGQIVTVHQKTGNKEEQKSAIHILVEKSQEVIKSGKIMDGEQLWEQAVNYSISTSLAFALEINTIRINSLMDAGMYNSTNNAFKQILSFIEKDDEQLIEQGNRIAAIAADLFSKKDNELSKSFILTAITYYKKAESYDRATNLLITMSQNFIQNEDEVNGIELIDTAANIANEIEGAHEAAKIYLTSGFALVEKGFINSGKLSIDKAIDIELQTKNIPGCNELGDLALQKANDLANSNLEIAIEIYSCASKIYESANSFSKAGEVHKIISLSYMNIGNALKAVNATEHAIDMFLKGKNVELAVGITKQTIAAARRFFNENDITQGVLILEKSRYLIEKTSRFDLLAQIIGIYLDTAKQNLPNRKSAIGIFFLNRAIALAKSSPDPEEIKRVVDSTLKLAIEIISKKNSIAGAKVVEIAAKQDIAKAAMMPNVSETFVEAIRLTLNVEWNMIGKITRDAMKFFKDTNQVEVPKQVIAILTKRANADILLNKPQLGFFFLEHAIKLARDAGNPALLAQIGGETFEQLLVLEVEGNFEINYRMLGYCHQIFQDIQNMDYIERIGKEFVKLGSKDLIANMQSIRGYEALLTAREISVQTQNNNLMSTVVLALLDFALQQSSKNPLTTLSTLSDIIEGLTLFEVPKSKRAIIEYQVIGDYIKSLMNFGEKKTKSDSEYKTGKKIIESCMRILVLSMNHGYVEKELADVSKNFQKLFKRANTDASYKFRHVALLMIDLHNTNEAINIAENSFRTSQALFERKKYQESIDFLDTALKLNHALAINTELKNIGLFALSAGDRLVNEAKIQESLIYYDIAIEAFDLANDDENSNRLVNRIFQTREWDADITIAYRVYKIASDSAVRIRNKQKAVEIATKCFNRGIAFIDQPRIPIDLSQKFISLAGKVYEDIGAIKEAANIYDKAILKFIKLMKSRKNVEEVITELLTRTAVDRMASCDMDSLETIFLRVMELAEMKKSKATKTIARTLKLINSSKVGDAWDLIASIPLISHGRIRKIIKLIKNRISYELQTNGTFDRTIFSTTDRSLPLSEYLLQNLLISRRIEGQPINKDVFISFDKIKAIRAYVYSEYDLWGRIDLDALTTEFGIQSNDAASIVRREFLSSLYMAILDNEQKIFYSFDRLKAEISVILNRERKKATRFDPMQVANEMRIPPDIIKEVLREITCEEVVENVSVK